MYVFLEFLMNKRNLMTTLFVATMAAISFGLTACSDNGVTPVDPAGIRVDMSTSFDLNAFPTEFTDASLDQPMVERPDPNKGRPVRTPFADLLRRLNLTSEQQTAVQALLASHNDCVKAALEALRAAEKAIIDAAKAEAEAIKQQAKDSVITREEARTQLRALNQRTREALKALPGREEARAAVKACDDAFIAALRGLLDEKQTGMLNSWLERRGKKPSDGDKGPRGGDSTGNGGRGPNGGGTGRG
jgi:hypothetical protein